MTGLNFYTTTIINDANVFSGDAKGLKVKYDFNFKPEWVNSIIKAKGYEAQKAVATIDLSSIATKAGFYRLDVYITFEGSDPAIGANVRDTQKGIPFWIEISVDGTEAAANIATKLVKAINKAKTFIVGTELITAAASDATVTLSATQEFIRFKKVDVLKFDEVSEYNTLVVSGTIAEAWNAMGTFSQIVKDLRLPTAANTAWTAKYKDEAPVVGAVYDQYIIYYLAPSCNVSMQAVGGKTDSLTTHVFWVNQTISEDFDNAIKAGGLEIKETVKAKTASELGE